jgi:outer membrane lipoprotein-sorting protein
MKHLTERLWCALRWGAVAGLALTSVWAQPSAQLLARLNRFAETFKGAKATVQNTNHVDVKGVLDEIETGSFLIKRDSATKVRLRIDITGNNAYTAVLGDRLVEIYHPKLNEIEEYNLRQYKNLSQQLMQLGFGAAGRDIAKSYEIRSLRREAIDGEDTTVVELIPKSEEVRNVVSRAELWIADKSTCAIQQKLYFKGGEYKLARFKDLVVNPNIPSSAFDLPKQAKRTRMN